MNFHDFISLIFIAFLLIYCVMAFFQSFVRLFPK